MLRIDTISRHVRSAIGAPIQEVLLADGTVQVSVLDVVLCGSDAYVVVEMVLGPLLVKEGHGMGRKGTGSNWRIHPPPLNQWAPN